MVSILIMDKQPVVRCGLKYIVEKNSDIVVAAETGDSDEVFQCYVERRPDVVIMDLSLSDNSALETSRKIIQFDLGAKILIFSAQENELLVSRARECGIKGYLNKMSNPEQIINAIKALAQGESCFNESVLTGSKPTYWGVNLLTPREFEVFRYLAEGHTVSEIAQMLNTSPKTIGVHQTRIIKKLGVSNSAQIAHIALSGGIIELQEAAREFNPSGGKSKALAKTSAPLRHVSV